MQARYISIPAVALALALSACGGSGGGNSATAKAGDCIDSGSQVVDCGSSDAARTLVSDQDAPKATACVQIGAEPQTEVKVDGGTFCAQAISDRTSSTETSSTHKPKPKPNPRVAFEKGLEPVLGALQRTAVGMAAVVRQAHALTDQQLAARLNTLATQWQRELPELSALTPPADLEHDFKALTDTAGGVWSAAHILALITQGHRADLAKRATERLAAALLATKSAAVRVQHGL